MNPDGTPIERTVVTKKRLKIVVAVIFLLLVLWIVMNIVNSGRIEITGRSDTPKDSTISVEVVLPAGKDPIKLELKAGEVKKLALKKGSYRINSSVGNLKSVDVVNVRGLKTSKVTVPKGEQHAIHKLGSNAQYCPLIFGGQVYSYNCSGDGAIYRHNKLDSNTLDSRTPMFDNATFSSLKPIQGGLVGLFANEEDSKVNILAFANLQTGALESIKLSGEVEDKLVEERPNIIANPQNDKPYFLMVFNRGGAAFLFRSIHDTEPVKLALPQNASLSDNFGVTTFSFFGDRIIAYAGKADGLEELNEEDFSSEPVPDYGNSIYEFDFAGRAVKTIDLPKSFTATDAYKINESFYAMMQNDGLELYHYKDNHFSKIYSLEEGNPPLVVGNKVYAAAGGGSLFAFQGNDDGSFSLENVFSSPAIDVSQLYYSPDGVLFTGNAARMDQRPLDIYQLLDSKQTIPPVEETVDFGKLGGIATGYDYDDTHIIFAITYTEAGDYETLRSRMELKLKDLGMDVGTRRVELYPLN